MAASTGVLECCTMGQSERARKFSLLIEHPAFPLVLLGIGFLARASLALTTYLNPDEAMHYWLSVQPSLRTAYQATRTTAHPPLFILLLYFWHKLGHSEFVLRIPSVLAGTGFCWISFRWLEKVTSRSIALLTYILLLFSPSLIALSAEVRQYALMLLFIAGSLYFFEVAVARNSHKYMVLSGASFLLALLAHYSALFFAVGMALYAIVRLYPRRQQRTLILLWLITQLFALALCLFLFAPHLASLRQQGLLQQISDTWLRKSIFHSSQESFALFLGRQSVRLFRYLLGQPAAGGVAMVFFFYGLFALFRTRAQPTLVPRRDLGVILLSPLIAGIAASSAFPYGGTRHDAYLALFVLTTVALGISNLPFRYESTVLATIVVLALCNLNPSPGGPYIRPRDQREQWMLQAAGTLRRSASPGAIIFTDSEGGLVLGYYLCDRNLVSLWPAPEAFHESACGQYQVITTGTRNWSLQAEEFSSLVSQMTAEYGVGPSSEVWFFRSGWGIANDPAWYATLSQFGCGSPLKFGANVLLCRLRLAGTPRTLSSAP